MKIPLLAITALGFSILSTSAQQPSNSAIKSGRKDWLGTPFVEDKAPRLVYMERATPRPLGNDYNFAPQKAKNVINFLRFPEFKLHPRKKVIWWGPLYTDTKDNLHYTRGITHLCNHPKYREKLQEMKVTGKQLTHWFEGMERHAGLFAEHIKKHKPEDPRIPWLEEWSKDQRLIDNEETAKAFGAFCWDDVMGTTRGEGVEFLTIDIESFKASTRTKSPWQTQYQNMMGWIYQGFIEESKKKGKPTRMVTYSQSLGIYSTLHYSSDPSDWGMTPGYLHPRAVGLTFAGGSGDKPVNPNTPSGKALISSNGFICEDAYQRQTYYEHVYKQKPDGTLILDKGAPVYRDDEDMQDAYGIKIGVTGVDKRTSVGGNANESRAYLDTIFQKAQQLWNNTYWAAGGKMPEWNTSRQPGLENLNLGSMSRHDIESFNLSVGDDRYGDRPLNPAQVEGIHLLTLLLSDLSEYWSSEVRVTPIGSEVKYRYAQDGPYEYMLKGSHRLSEFNFIFDQPYRPIFPKLLMYKGNKDDGERYDQKPIVIGGIFERNRQPYCWLYWWFPANIGRGALDAKVWFDNGKMKSSVYPIKFVGDRVGLDVWKLPANLTGLMPKDFQIEFSDLTGKKHRWCGDYRVTDAAILKAAK